MRPQAAMASPGGKLSPQSALRNRLRRLMRNAGGKLLV
ncbi:MAG: hypothetical protein E7448_05415 [Ruminococcaceae bacterium]|nr:hypothetical protein [Oscillospiraceae bacterium]